MSLTSDFRDLCVLLSPVSAKNFKPKHVYQNAKVLFHYLKDSTALFVMLGIVNSCIIVICCCMLSFACRPQKCKYKFCSVNYFLIFLFSSSEFNYEQTLVIFFQRLILATSCVTYKAHATRSCMISDLHDLLSEPHATQCGMLSVRAFLVTIYIFLHNEIAIFCFDAPLLAVY